jgi:MoaA/NifB/PqqE/SkfB family radical SAM enzyme
MKDFCLEQYLSTGVEHIVAGALKVSLRAPQQGIFFAKFAKASKQASNIRTRYAEQGQHIPPFLIASITTQCNLHCAGCYAMEHQKQGGCGSAQTLSAEQWDHIFLEAENLGISFILIAGGEPLMRPDVLQRASKYSNILFPVFTNGTLMSEDRLTLFDRNRNLVPMLSIEGDAGQTDLRRGVGVYEKLLATMTELKERHILFGSSITVTTKNVQEVTDSGFLDLLAQQGCKVVLFVEYVPAQAGTESLSLTEEDRAFLEQRLRQLRGQKEDMLFISFPGDELASGGCLAAGRGFIHINPNGGAEPCPFSPFSDTNLREHSLLEALNSPLFTKLKSGSYLTEHHNGGCVLFSQQDTVLELARGI